MITGREAMNSKNDCSVRAISNALQIDYMTAYGMMLALGRTNRRGIDSIKLRQFLNSLDSLQSYPRPNMTVESYLKHIAHSGRWLIDIRGHIFCSVDGKVTGDWMPADSHCHVISAWRVK